MISDGIFDHRLVSTNHKSRFLDKQEQADRLQCVYRRFWQASIEIVNNYYKLVNLGFFEKFTEFISEGMYMLRQRFL